MISKVKRSKRMMSWKLLLMHMGVEPIMVRMGEAPSIPLARIRLLKMLGVIVLSALCVGESLAVVSWSNTLRLARRDGQLTRVVSSNDEIYIENRLINLFFEITLIF